MVSFHKANFHSNNVGTSVVLSLIFLKNPVYTPFHCRIQREMHSTYFSTSTTKRDRDLLLKKLKPGTNKLWQGVANDFFLSFN